MHMNNPMYFELQADNPEALLHFYQSVFQWTFEKQPGLPVDYWHIETEGIAGGLLRRPAAAPATGSGTNAAVISMEVPSFDDTAALILAQSGAVAMPKFAIPGRCWQGYFIDTEGNTFGIFEVDPKAA